jgi:hypothetical protein
MCVTIVGRLLAGFDKLKHPGVLSSFGKGQGREGDSLVWVSYEDRKERVQVMKEPEVWNDRKMGS